jgi:hypothetical protein
VLEGIILVFDYVSVLTYMMFACVTWYSSTDLTLLVIFAGDDEFDVSDGDLRNELN